MKDLIAAWVINPSKSLFKSSDKNARPALITIECSSKDNCDYYKRGQCRLLDMFSNCSFGTYRRSEGPTRRSKSFSKFIEDSNKFVIEKTANLKKLERPSDKMGIINDTVFLPYSGLGSEGYMGQEIPLLTKNGFLSSSPNTMKLSEFTKIENIVKIINHSPQAIFGGEITSYQKEQVPKFIKHLKEIFPDLYAELILKHPELSSIFEASRSDIGRVAKLSTLKPNVGKFVDIHKGEWTWDGEFLSSVNSKASFMLVKEFSLMQIKPMPDAEVKVTSDDQVTSETVFKD